MPGCKPDEVLLQVKEVGVCGSDITIYLGKHRRARPPLIIGHEFSGVVASVGSAVSGFTPGERVVVEPTFSCGSCRWCNAGRYNLCDHVGVFGVDAPGAFADYVSILLHPKAGTVRFEGESIAALPPDQIVAKGIVQVPEGREIFPGLTVLENLEMGATAWRKSRRLPTEDLERVFDLFPRLRERRKQLGWALSGGEQQMLAVGRGLMARPKLLLLDEPSLGLAPVVVEEVFAAISSINKQGTTILLVEQNANMAMEFASRGYVIENGQTVLDGPTSMLKANERVKEAYLGA